MVSLDDIKREALELLPAVDDGKELDEKEIALISLAVHASPAVLDMEGARTFASKALGAGASSEEIQETLVLISGLGVHTLMEGSRMLTDLLQERGSDILNIPLDGAREKLWSNYVGDDPFWDVMEKEVPGFLEALVRLSPEGFAAFFEYCSVPWKTAALRARTKELISLAVDSSPAHRFVPGARLHIMNAIKLGVGRGAILQTLEIAANAPLHEGVQRHVQ
ncbi:hypothetical protein [Marinobacter salarius]|uniref:hypothetical protein n=1 Tax=Marinobacter salarius TaxID=1420917 RepID=UPI003D0B00EC